jgi:hypothetical protein
MKKKKLATTAVALSLAAITVFSVGGNYAYANTNADIAVQAEVSSESVVIPVYVASEAWNCGKFGTWKVLNIKVNDTMYPLSKDGAVSITFHNGDNIKVYAGDSYELCEGYIRINGDNISVISKNVSEYKKGCNLIYSDGRILLSGTENYSCGNLIAVSEQVYYKYDLTAKTEGVTPIEGIAIKDNSIFGYSYGSNLRYSIVDSNYVWGNGNSYSLECKSIDEEAVWVLDTTRITDSNGYTDMYLPDECISDDYSQKVYMGGNISYVFSDGRTKAYLSNGLVDVTINNENYTTTKSLGLEASFGVIGTDKVLGDYYDASKMSLKSDCVTLQDEAGKDIATVTMELKETDDMHLIGRDGYTYKATGLEPTADIKMADGATDWTVSVTTEDNTFHINVVKNSAFTPSAQNGLCCDENGVWNYYVNGSVDYNYTGLANNEYGWFYVKNGSVDWSYTGLANNEYGWFYISNGVLDWSYTGLANNEYGWFYVSNGALDWGYTGLANNEYGWFYVKNGSVDWSYTGLANNEYGWFYISNGVLDWSYTGLANNEYGWFYVSDGVLDWGYTGLANNEYGWFYVSNGAVDWSYTGQADNIYGTWNVVNGQVVF